MSCPCPLSGHRDLLEAADASAWHLGRGLFLVPGAALSCVQGEPEGGELMPQEGASSDARWRIGGQKPRSPSPRWVTWKNVLPTISEPPGLVPGVLGVRELGTHLTRVRKFAFPAHCPSTLSVPRDPSH